MNRMPAMTMGRPSIRTTIRAFPGTPVLLRLPIYMKTLQAIPASKKIIPPASSHFQAIRRTISITIEGRRWIRRDKKFCHKVLDGLKESKANRLIKRIVRSPRIRGAQ